MYGALVVLSTAAVCCLCQRSPYAGRRPIGYPELETTTTTVDPLGNRFGEATTERLPIEALGDRELVNRLSKLPIDNQPFWLINWKQLEEQRKNPQTYPQKPNVFNQLFENPSQPTTAASNTNTQNRFGASSNVHNANPHSKITMNKIKKQETNHETTEHHDFSDDTRESIY